MRAVVGFLRPPRLIIDPGFLTFVGVAALLVLSPGPTFAVVTRNAAASGRASGVATALGIGVANATHAAASALGLSVALRQSPAAFETIRLVGAAYLAWLGVSGLWRLVARETGVEPAPGTGGRSAHHRSRRGFGQGVLTNLLHPSVAMFYLSYLPQFIDPGEPFLTRYAVLASVHVGLSVGWMTLCAIAVDRLSRVVGTPAFARSVETLASASLLVLGVLLAVGRR